MGDKPTIEPGVLAEIIENAPSRLVRKLEKKGNLAADYTWSCADDLCTIDTGKETVTLSGSTITAADQVSCTCLLAPKCLHILATVSSLEASAQVVVAENPEVAVEAETLDALTESQVDAARTLFDAGVRVLDQGAAHARMTTVSELLRAVHQCRLEGLHRAASAGLRIAESIRLLRDRSPGFDLTRLSAELTDLFETTTALQHGHDGLVWRGTARRRYRDIGGKKVVGLFVEPISAKTGYAGVVAYVWDPRDNEFWTLSDVKPGESTRIPGAYKGGVSVGDASMSPRDLARSGLFLQSATGSSDGRLGAGKQVKAVGTSPSTWQGSLGDGPWKTPLADQLDTVWKNLDTPPLLRSPGADLVFFDATSIGANDDALILETEQLGAPAWIRCTAPLTNEHVAYVDNMRLIARAPGLKLRVIARVRFDRPHSVELLAAAPLNDDEHTLTLPEHWQGHFNMGLDRLDRAWFSDAAPQPVNVAWPEASMPDPLTRMRRRLNRAAYGGRMTLRPSVLDDVKREARELQVRMMPHAASLLMGVGDAAQPRGRTLTGESRIDDPTALAIAWTRAVVFERHARRTIQRKRFL